MRRGQKRQMLAVNHRGKHRALKSATPQDDGGTRRWRRLAAQGEQLLRERFDAMEAAVESKP